MLHHFPRQNFIESYSDLSECDFYPKKERFEIPHKNVLKIFKISLSAIRNVYSNERESFGKYFRRFICEI